MFLFIIFLPFYLIIIYYQQPKLQTSQSFKHAHDVLHISLGDFDALFKGIAGHIAILQCLPLKNASAGLALFQEFSVLSKKDADTRDRVSALGHCGIRGELAYVNSSVHF